MAALVVVDSGILLSTVLIEKYTQTAQSLVRHWNKNKIQLAAPILFQYEIVAVVRRSVYQKRLTLEEAARVRDRLLSYGVQFHLDDLLLKRAFELATQFNRPTAYDSQYLAVAERLGCEFWTADERLYNAVTGQLNWVKWVGNFTG